MKKERLKISTGAIWEEIVGYSRAVRAGNIIEVSGTIALDKNGKSVAVGDPYRQTIQIISIARKVLEEAGSGLEDVIRTRIYVTDLSMWEEIGRAHGELFRKIKPATSMIEVSRLIRSESLVEIEFTALVDE
jgi:enamine deaminase RidA (YjgF/YER057c/UK114 family)